MRIHFVLTLAWMAVTIVPPALSAAQLEIVTSFYPIYVETLNVAGSVPGVDVVNLAPPNTGCLHDYLLSPADMTKLESADVLVVNGGGMEDFLDKITAQKPSLKILNASKGIPMIADGQGVNAHVWVSPSNAIRQVRTIAAELSILDPSHADAYRHHADQYVGKLESLLARMTNELAPLQGRSIVTFHSAFAYFAEAFKLRVAAVVEREPGSQPSARELADLIQTVRAAHVDAIFAEPQYPTDAADTIAKESGAKVFLLDPVVTGPLNDPDAYLRAMDRNADTLLKAMQK